jgi:hypothetical protein
MQALVAASRHDDAISRIVSRIPAARFSASDTEVPVGRSIDTSAAGTLKADEPSGMGVRINRCIRRR